MDNLVKEAYVVKFTRWETNLDGVEVEGSRSVYYRTSRNGVLPMLYTSKGKTGIKETTINKAEKFDNSNPPKFNGEGHRYGSPEYKEEVEKRRVWYKEVYTPWVNSRKVLGYFHHKTEVVKVSLVEV